TRSPGDRSIGAIGLKLKTTFSFIDAGLVVKSTAEIQGDRLLAATQAGGDHEGEEERASPEGGKPGAFAGAASAPRGLAGGRELRRGRRHRRRGDASAVLADLVGAAEAVRHVVPVAEAGVVDLAVAVVVEAVALFGRRADRAVAVAPLAV